MIMLFNDCPEAESWSSPCWRLLGEVLLVGQALLKDPPAFHHDAEGDGDGEGDDDVDGHGDGHGHGHGSDCLDQVSSKF